MAKKESNSLKTNYNCPFQKKGTWTTLMCAFCPRYCEEENNDKEH